MDFVINCFTVTKIRYPENLRHFMYQKIPDFIIIPTTITWYFVLVWIYLSLHPLQPFQHPAPGNELVLIWNGFRWGFVGFLFLNTEMCWTRWKAMMNSLRVHLHYFGKNRATSQPNRPRKVKSYPGADFCFVYSFVNLVKTISIRSTCGNPNTAVFDTYFK